MNSSVNILRKLPGILVLVLAPIIGLGQDNAVVKGTITDSTGNPIEAVEEWNTPSRELHLQPGYTFLEDEGEGSQLVVTKYIPSILFNRYRNAALKKASVRQLDDGSWYADISALPGVWANELNPRDCLNVLDEVVIDWVLLKIEHKDRDIPVLDEINLNDV